MEKTTKVIISFDAEFSINGAFADPVNKKPASAQFMSPHPSQTLGLQDVLTILQQHQVAATFFTEALNANYFGVDEMGRYVQQMVAHGHDIQLHTHPCWTVFQQPHWPELVKGRPVADTFESMPLQDVIAILQHALDVCAAWQIPPPRSFRAGNLCAVPELYHALSTLGFTTASNVGLAIHRPKAAELCIENTSARFQNVIELPVTTFHSIGVRHKSLTITGTSFTETKAVLQQCIKHEIDYVVILTHIHEFRKYSATDVRPNRVNLNRLAQLCAFVNQHPQLSFTTFGALGQDAAFTAAAHKPHGKAIQTPWFAGAITMVENLLNDKIWNY